MRYKNRVLPTAAIEHTTSGARAQTRPPEIVVLAFGAQPPASYAIAADQHVAYCVKFPSCGSVLYDSSRGFCQRHGDRNPGASVDAWQPSIRASDPIRQREQR